MKRASERREKTFKLMDYIQLFASALKNSPIEQDYLIDYYIDMKL
jgi:hypothetical protein